MHGGRDPALPVLYRHRGVSCHAGWEQSIDTEDSGSSDGWMQLLMPQDWNYEADPEQNLPTGSDMDISAGSITDMDID